MPRVLQGDIFATARAHESELTIVFGSMGFNHMKLYWPMFAVTVASLSHIRDPFSDVLPQPYEYTPGRWLWFIRERENHGMTESDVRYALDAAFSWARQNGLKTVITNGIADTVDHSDIAAKQKSNDRRARLLIGLASDCERRFGLDITLVSLGTVFTRNVP